MNKEKRYIGVTIGPIYSTFVLAEKTREFWGASYLFSWLCRKVLEEIRTTLPTAEVLMPVVDVLKQQPVGIGVYPDRIVLGVEKGDYDEIVCAILKVKGELVDNILASIKEYQQYDPYARLQKGGVVNDQNREQARNFLFRYFRVYSLEVPPEAMGLKRDRPKDPQSVGKDEEPSKVEVLKEMNFYLDHLELEAPLGEFDPNPLKVFLRGINHSFLNKIAFGQFDHFPSLAEISSVELGFIRGGEGRRFLFRDEIMTLAKNSLYGAIKAEKKNTQSIKESYEKCTECCGAELQNELDDKSPEVPQAVLQKKIKEWERTEDDLLKNIFSIPGISGHLRTYHRYVAVVCADGDRMGKAIGTLTTGEVPGFSADLALFAQEANKVIAGNRFIDRNSDDWGYGGAPIYIGGDDLVFFAPVVSRGAEGEVRTIFHLIRDIDSKFNQIFNEKNKGDGNYVKYPDLKDAGQRPCVSYGISVTYVKFPLQEAYQKGHSLLSEMKQEKYKTRNRVNFLLRKHSGQLFGGVIDKNDDELFSEILALLEDHGDKGMQPVGRECEVFVNSVVTKLKQYESVLNACSGTEDERIGALFDNLFNESVHDQYRDYLNRVGRFLAHCLESVHETENREDSFREAMEMFYGVLRFIHFIRSDEFRD